ncbi:tyrosine-protein phosphatase Cdc14p [Trichomonascus vanleenenianus]|uniref:phosphoprotein phosphatase CDC14 n=1 Tax=Trichomonascus vanleenenianus TaxID=2268995 RepID=UPI003EC9A78E
MALRRKIPIIEFLKDKIYLAAYDSAPEDTPTTAHFTIDDALPYNSFHHDFGPLHIGHLYRFAVTLHEILADEDNEGKAIVLYSRTSPKARANAACVLCCYMVLIQSWPPHLALAPIAQANPPLMPFRDAGYAPADFTLSIQDIVYGVWRAKEQKLLDLKTFNLEEYELYERVDQGDFNEIPPHFVAFASPQQEVYNAPLNYPFCQVLDYFQANDVQLVVRLNSELYDRREFEKRGVKHIDLIFEDGTCPTMAYVQAFLGAVEGVIANKGKVAVHCKAGLGRTGCLIGAHLIYTYGFTAQEVIGYMRFLRPGMVVGPQQHWLYLHQNEFREWKRTMTLSKISDESLSGFKPLVPIGSEDASTPPNSIRRSGVSPPRTPERSILGEVDNTNSALPVPTPGQPRKNSPSPARGPSRPDGTLGAVHNARQGYRGGVENGENDMIHDYKAGKGNNGKVGRARYRVVSARDTNSDEEEAEEEEESNSSSSSVSSGDEHHLSTPRKPSSETSLSTKEQIAIGQKLRSTSNPSPQRRTRANAVNSYYPRTTTTTTSIISSSPPNGSSIVASPDREKPLRRSARVASNGGVRKVSAGSRR